MPPIDDDFNYPSPTPVTYFLIIYLIRIPLYFEICLTTEVIFLSLKDQMQGKNEILRHCNIHSTLPILGGVRGNQEVNYFTLIILGGE